MVSAFRLSPRAAAAVTVISPATGDTAVAGGDFLIQWKNTTNNIMTLSLRQGSPDNMTLVHVIANTNNNGSWHWRSRDDDYFQGAYPNLYGAPSSNCNYAMEFRTAGEVINSGYFTILNVKDGGITANMSCAGGALQGGGPLRTDNPAQKSTRGSGVSPGVLAGAVSGVFVAVILLLGVLVMVSKKKGWILSRREYEELIEARLQSEKKSLTAHSQPLPFDKDVAQVAGREIHQMM